MNIATQTLPIAAGNGDPTAGDPQPGAAEEFEECPICSGTGWLNERRCPTCAGHGTVAIEPETEEDHE